ncbi:MFS transporter [Candidatus Latescibacterota bacterium]
MPDNRGLSEYYKYLVFAFIFGFGGSVWGGLTYYLGQPVAYLNFLKASPVQIGAVSTIFWAGFAFPQVWAAYKSESFAIKKNFFAWSIVISSFGFLIAGIHILLTGAANSAASIWIFLLCYTWACIVCGMYIPANFALLFKIIPTERLGQLLGRMFAVQFGGTFVSIFAVTIIANLFGEPTRYAVLFIITFLMTIIAGYIIVTLKEPEGEVVQGSPSLSSYIGKLFTIFKTDTLFTKFIFGKWLMSGHYIMQAFLLTFLLQERGFNPDNSGWFTSFNGLGLMIGGFTITKIADSYGPKYMLITSQIMAIIYTLVVWLIPSINPVFVVGAFIFTGLAQISDNVGYSNMTMFCCPTEDKTTYVAAVNIGIILPMVLLPIVIGKFIGAGVFGFNGAFAISVAMMAAAILYIIMVVENPKSFVDMKASMSD